MTDSKIVNAKIANFTAVAPLFNRKGRIAFALCDADEQPHNLSFSFNEDEQSRFLSTYQRLLEAVKVPHVSKMPGWFVRLVTAGNSIVAIGHVIEESWYRVQRNSPVLDDLLRDRLPAGCASPHGELNARIAAMQITHWDDESSVLALKWKITGESGTFDDRIGFRQVELPLLGLVLDRLLTVVGVRDMKSLKGTLIRIKRDELFGRIQIGNFLTNEWFEAGDIVARIRHETKQVARDYEAAQFALKTATDHLPNQRLTENGRNIATQVLELAAKKFDAGEFRLAQQMACDVLAPCGDDRYLNALLRHLHPDQVEAKA